MITQHVVRILTCGFVICILGFIPRKANCQLFNNAGSSQPIKSVNLAGSKDRNDSSAAMNLKRGQVLPIVSQDAPVETARDIKFCMPLSKMRLTSTFGWRRHPVTGKDDFHKGVDLSARSEPVFSILKGTVIETGFNPILGNFIRIDHGTVQSVYGHLSFIMVRRHQTVDVTELIGVTGSSGRVTGEHLHFSIKTADDYIHPLHFLKGLKN